MSALSTFTVLELSESAAGEYCGKLLADFGADVIKIEKPTVGSPTRSLGPFANNAPADSIERSGLFAYLNTNKRSVAFDLTAPAGAKTLRNLLDRVDVVIDDHAPGWLAAMGLDPAKLAQSHPRLVLCSITPYGQAPADERAHAEDLTIFHSSGWGYHTPSGADPSRAPLSGPGRFFVSYDAGMEAALCIAAALYDRAEPKLGRFIDISKHAVMASRADYVLAQMVAGEMDVSAGRAAFDLRGPGGVIPCRDGYVYVWLSAPSHWDALSAVLGSPDWMQSFPERWLERACTPERVAESRMHIAEWLKTQGKNDAAEIAQKHGLTLVPVNSVEDVAASPQYQFRAYFAETTHPVLGRVKQPTAPYKLSATPVTITTPAPLLGQHTDEALSALRAEAKP